MLMKGKNVNYNDVCRWTDGTLGNALVLLMQYQLFHSWISSLAVLDSKQELITRNIVLLEIFRRPDFPELTGSVNTPTSSHALERTLVITCMLQQLYQSMSLSV